MLLFAVTDTAAKPVGIGFGLGSGVLFQMLQKPLFDSWKAANWVKPHDGRYKPTKIGLMFGAGLECLAAEAAVIFAFVMLAPAGWIKL